jgi:tetratricopeptide (TPR) repeat protein
MYSLKKYITMNNFIAALTVPMTRFGMLLTASMLATSLLLASAHADELKDISQMADQGQTVAALDRINSFIAANPKNASALFMKGVLLAEQGRRDEAIKVFTEVTDRFPTLPEPYNNLAVLYADQGQFDKARKALETAIKTHPSYSTAHENLGDIYARMASEAYDKALQLDTGNTRTQTKLSLIKDLFGTGNKTTIAAKEAVKTEPVKVANVIRPAEIKTAESKPAATKPAATKKIEVIAEPVVADTPKSNNEALIAAAHKWSQAWESKNLDQYFASYGNGFNPGKGLSRKAWEEQRRSRINIAAKISVELSNISVTTIDSNNAKVRFKQIYRANNKPINTIKTLVMKKAGDNWFIEEENLGR